MGSHKAARVVSYRMEQCRRCGKDSDKLVIRCFKTNDNCLPNLCVAHKSE